MKLSDHDIAELEQLVQERKVNRVKHPVFDLYNYKYSQSCQKRDFDTTILLMCRGLVLDAAGNVISRGFNKFFNDFELSSVEKRKILDNQRHEVTEKFDGTCVLLSEYENKKFFRTLGSFVSWQANYCNNHYLENHDYEFDKDYEWLTQLDTKRFTYIFEFLHPEDKKIVSYDFGPCEIPYIVLIGIIDNETGQDLLYPEIVEHLESLHINRTAIKMIRPIYRNIDPGFLGSLNPENKEGVVIHSRNGRMKIKFQNYWERFKLRFMLTPRYLFDKWSETFGNEELRNKFLEEVEKTDPELRFLVEENFRDYDLGYDYHKYDIVLKFREDYYKKGISRKEFAQAVRKDKDSALLFIYYDLSQKEISQEEHEHIEKKFHDALIKLLKREILKTN